MAGRLYPTDGPRSRISDAECAVYRALAAGGLPDGWSVWHSLRLRVGNGWEGEGDFVIADPKRGLLVLEVKGGRVELQGGRWLQNAREMDRPPRVQAIAFAKHLGDAMRSHGFQVPGYGAACAFPDVDFDAGPNCGDVAGLIIGHRDLPHLAAILPGLLDRAAPDFALPTGDWIRCLTELWGETWVPAIPVPERKCVHLDPAPLCGGSEIARRDKE
jgi:Nuclease-related domain